jgi:predicted O-methyltransferase YrrM
VSLQVSVIVGPANQGIEQLAKQGVRFDLAFLDADKGGYLGYYNQVAAQTASTLMQGAYGIIVLVMFKQL